MPRAIGAGRSTTASGLHRPFSDPAAVDGVASWPPIGTLAFGSLHMEQFRQLPTHCSPSFGAPLDKSTAGRTVRAVVNRRRTVTRGSGRRASPRRRGSHRSGASRAEMTARHGRRRSIRTTARDHRLILGLLALALALRIVVTVTTYQPALFFTGVQLGHLEFGTPGSGERHGRFCTQSSSAWSYRCTG